ncbi:hypothetical protein [Mycobacterium intracellulare]|uniref:Uncharacterized protein n=1 Tax=Mycobacterium intracellulare TaxID=1767 RepID=A0AAE4R881_MYCIT|nr:hypothetical protein [Mycobacterium intracellulare]MDV6975312.1 hypothetical protein [Mycobacterium intracellulare]MDV6980376.1 hypothetical protein [Mycobacterium intracellulare]MDV7010805.1 hypothetical protein [Mycobacterium intracellulare]MDV7025711.1 hypothetical protein [Mycobacterium intracellulare]
MSLVATAALLVALLALWSVRATWAIPWERPAALAVAFLTAQLILMAGPVSAWLSPKLFALTGLWNIEDLAAHIFYLCGMWSILFLVADRLDMSPNQFRWYVRYRIELPSILAYTAMIAAFVFGGVGDQYVPDPVSSDPTPGLYVYWLVMIAAIAYIIAHAGWILLQLRRDPRSKRAATAYLCALCVNGAGIVVFAAPGLVHLQWIMVRAEVVAYAIAASYTWRSKRADLPRPR